MNDDRTQYYKEYYYNKRDLHKYIYYEKRERERKMKEVYKEFGGEREYYKIKYKQFFTGVNNT